MAGAPAYEEIRDQLFADRKLFVDPAFPPVESSVYITRSLPRSVVWKRPLDVDSNAVFLHERAHIEVKQGPYGNNAMIAAICAAAFHDDLFRFIVPPDQPFRPMNKYIGMFHFRFWKYGRWKDIVIDDLLPFNEDEERFMTAQTREPHEFWLALFEKAYAKFYGSYELMELRSASEALVDISGGIAETYTLTRIRAEIFSVMLKAYARNSLMTLTIHHNKTSLAYTGLAGEGRSYIVTKVANVDLIDRVPSLLRLFNPWGAGTWKGSWSESSPMWRSMPEFTRTELGFTRQHENEFWIDISDILKYFTLLEICNIDPNQPWCDTATTTVWHVKSFRGRWNSSGGPPGLKGSFHKNPQERIEIKESSVEDDGHLTVRVALHQRGTALLHVKKYLEIGIAIFTIGSSQGSTRLKRSFFEKQDPEAIVPCSLTRESVLRTRLTAGSYVIVPHTSHSGDIGDFILRILTANPIISRPIDVFDGETDSEETLQRPTVKRPLPHEIVTRARASRWRRAAKPVIYTIFAILVVMAYLPYNRKGKIRQKRVKKKKLARLRGWLEEAGTPALDWRQMLAEIQARGSPREVTIYLASAITLFLAWFYIMLRNK